MKDGLWHTCFPPLWPRKDINGLWLCFQNGTILRRWTGTQWQYLALPETYDQWADRQW